MRNFKLLLATATAALAATPAMAAGDTMVVNANVANACTFNAADVTVDMSSIRTGVTQSGNVQIWCTNGYAVKVSATSANAYTLVSGANTIAYSFTSGGAAFTNLNFTGGSAATFSNIPYTLTFAAQNPAAGSYTDTITFTVAP
ncbi:spore coat protein U domain-containing protein [Qipengyuania sediminis]|uniref:spore coat protein U domain-containing protein n=1 Tax=Qipengyuania sediminis TaxID=1532023 RepID=UPI0014055FF3|nr:spore coat protein U domain-containing protein [Qipengyuania sediminis]